MELGREPVRVKVLPRAVRSGVGYSAYVDFVGPVEKLCLVTRVYGLRGIGAAAIKKGLDLLVFVCSVYRELILQRA
jgi:hypothetical protein